MSCDGTLNHGEYYLSVRELLSVECGCAKREPLHLHSFGPLKRDFRAAWVWSICRSLGADTTACAFEGYREDSGAHVLLWFRRHRSRGPGIPLELDAKRAV